MQLHPFFPSRYTIYDKIEFSNPHTFSPISLALLSGIFLSSQAKLYRISPQLNLTQESLLKKTHFIALKGRRKGRE